MQAILSFFKIIVIWVANLMKIEGPSIVKRTTLKILHSYDATFLEDIRPLCIEYTICKGLQKKSWRTFSPLHFDCSTLLAQ